MFLAVALPVMQVAISAELTGELVIDDWSELEYNIQDDSALIHDAEIRYGTEMSIKAKLAHRIKARSGDTDQLTLSGGVHINYRGAVLDAESALIVFRGKELQSARVEGSQATFSHQPAGASRRVHGRANSINFEGASNQVHLSGNTSYSDGRNECRVEELFYNLDDGSFVNRRLPGGVVGCTLDLGGRDRVPAPRTPDRSTAQ